MKAKSERKATYSVVVENHNSWTQNENGGNRRYEITAECGHEHKTLEAAEKCMEKLTRAYCNHGHVAGTPCSLCIGYANADSWSARWYRASIRSSR